MSEGAKTAIQLLTAATAFIAALTGIWNTYQLATLEGVAGSNQTAINDHVNSDMHFNATVLRDLIVAAARANNEEAAP